MQYEYSSTDKERFSLHDCVATSVELINDRLIFYLPDGFFCKDYSNDWPNTGKAEIEFKLNSIEEVNLYLFVEAEGKTIRTQYTIEQMIEKINNKEWEIEFAYRYDGYEEILYKCWIWEKPLRRTYESELSIRTKENIIFRWNSPETD